MATTVSQHSYGAATPVSGHSGVSDVGRVTGALVGYTELTEHTGNTGTPVDAHSGVTGYTEVSQH